MSNVVTTVCEFGDPGRTACATFSPLDECDRVEVCKYIYSEIGISPPPPRQAYVVLNSIPVIQDNKKVTMDIDSKVLSFPKNKQLPQLVHVNTIELGDAIDTKQVDTPITGAVKRINIDMVDVNGMTIDGSGDKVLSDDGTYREFPEGIVDPDEFYKVDGSNPIIAPFASGSQKFSNAAKGTADNDLTTVEQVNDSIDESIELGTYGRRTNNDKD